MEIRSPSDGHPVGRVPVSSDEAVGRAVEACRRSQEGWGALDPDHRSRLLSGLREGLTERMEDVVDLIVQETGRPEVEAVAEGMVVLNTLARWERRAPKVLASRRVSLGGLVWKSGRIHRDPFGVVAVVGSWTAPFASIAGPAFAALFAGNGVVVRPSEHTPFTGRFLEEVSREAGLPDELVNVVQGRWPAVEALVRSGADRVHFRGGVEGARRVAGWAAMEGLPVTVEVEGKGAAVVLDDGDLDRAARSLAWGAFRGSGQASHTIGWIYVTDGAYDSFLRRFRKVVSRLRAGSGGGVDVGPLGVSRELSRLEAHVEDALARGARVVEGGARADPASNVFHPTVLAEVPRNARAALEPVAGPLVCLFRVADGEEALRWIREGPPVTSASVWTRSREEGERLATSLGGEGCALNDVWSPHTLAILGRGDRGDASSSRNGLDHRLLAFTRTRSVVKNRLPVSWDPWWFPYGESTLCFLRSFGGFGSPGGPAAGLPAAVRAMVRRRP